MNDSVRRLEAASETRAARFALKLAGSIIGVVMTALLALILTSLQEGNAIARDAQKTNQTQEVDIGLIKQRQALMWDTLHTAVTTQQELANRVTHLDDELQHQRATASKSRSQP